MDTEWKETVTACQGPDSTGGVGKLYSEKVKTKGRREK